MDEMIEEEIPLTAEQLLEIRNNAFYGKVTKGWVWNEEKISYVPPIDPPDNKYPYLWNEDTESWDPFPGYPRN